MQEVKTNIICRDCGEFMSHKDYKFYRDMLCGEIQKVDGKLEGCCRKCLNDRVACEDFDAEDFMAEFCG